MPSFRINQHFLNFFWIGAVPCTAALGYYMVYAPSKEQLAIDLVRVMRRVVCVAAWLTPLTMVAAIAHHTAQATPAPCAASTSVARRIEAYAVRPV